MILELAQKILDAKPGWLARHILQHNADIEPLMDDLIELALEGNEIAVRAIARVAIEVRRTLP